MWRDAHNKKIAPYHPDKCLLLNFNTMGHENQLQPAHRSKNITVWIFERRKQKHEKGNKTYYGDYSGSRYSSASVCAEQLPRGREYPQW